MKLTQPVLIQSLEVEFHIHSSGPIPQTPAVPDHVLAQVIEGTDVLIRSS